MVRRAWVAAQVTGLGAVVRDGDPDDALVRIVVVADVRQLGPAVALEGDQHSAAALGEQREQCVARRVLSHIRTTGSRPAHIPRTRKQAREQAREWTQE